jgi:hypothetical protein
VEGPRFEIGSGRRRRLPARAAGDQADPPCRPPDPVPQGDRRGSRHPRQRGKAIGIRLALQSFDPMLCVQ